jgi:ectoine hydroxylase-related dioxygenase (phytanoyl-CoA dioxygenase family)
MMIGKATSEAVTALGLERQVGQLDEVGYAVIEDLDAELCTRLRSDVLEHGASQMLLRRDPVFAEAVLAPPVLALVEHVVGRGALISQVTASIRSEGSPALPLHSDQNWMPAPFPEQSYMITVCWILDDFTEAGGATKVVPGSQRHRRHPDAAEIAAADAAVPIEAPAGSVALWDGAVWHGNYPRTAPGERVVLHVTYCRLAMRPIEDYRAEADALIAAHGETMAGLLGRHDALGGPNGFDWTKLVDTFAMGRS